MPWQIHSERAIRICGDKMLERRYFFRIVCWFSNILKSRIPNRKQLSRIKLMLCQYSELSRILRTIEFQQMRNAILKAKFYHLQCA